MSQNTSLASHRLPGRALAEKRSSRPSHARVACASSSARNKRGAGATFKPATPLPSPAAWTCSSGPAHTVAAGTQLRVKRLPREETSTPCSGFGSGDARGIAGPALRQPSTDTCISSSGPGGRSTVPGTTTPPAGRISWGTATATTGPVRTGARDGKS